VDVYCFHSGQLTTGILETLSFLIGTQETRTNIWLHHFFTPTAEKFQ